MHRNMPCAAAGLATVPSCIIPNATRSPTPTHLPHPHATPSGLATKTPAPGPTAISAQISSRPILKLHLEHPANTNAITGYGAGYVQVNQTRHAGSLIVLPQRLIEGWRPQSFADLQAEDFAELARLEVEIVLLGTGEQLRFPPPQFTRALFERRIGLESMSTAAACRTYNILMGEGRSVAAALLAA